MIKLICKDFLEVLFTLHYFTGVDTMKKVLSAVLAVLLLLCSVPVVSAGAADETTVSAISFKTEPALYAHAVAGANDADAWQAWQSEHDEDFNEVNPDVKYFFLPSSANVSELEIYNSYPQSVSVNGTDIPTGKSKTVSYDLDKEYKVSANGNTYTLRFMKSSAEAAIYINNTDADGNGTELIKYLNQDKSLYASATGAIVDKDGSIDNTTVKKIKGRGNTTWDKPKKAYNITYDSKVSIAGMEKGKKYSILANYQDDSLSRNRFLYDLSDAVGMPYASDSRYVDFYVDGFYWGSYQMTQKVDVGKSSLINDIDTDSYLNEDGTVKADFPFLCEVDAGAKDGDDYYVSASGNKITIKSPELNEGDPGYEEVKAYVKEKFTEFFNAATKPSVDLSQYADVESLTKLYLINELGKNWDAGVSSFFMTYKQDENGNYKFYGSPVWDYDNSLGNANGVSYELSHIGVYDYTEYTGWWCKFKDKDKNRKTSTNVLNNLARNKNITDAAPKIWFEEFMPAIKHFSGEKYSAEIDKELYTASEYRNLLKGSAEMNYKSGWLLDTGSWISDHSKLKKATFDYSTKTYTVESNYTSYDQSFDGMYNYCADWLTSRAAWLSSQMISDYTPSYELGDVNLDGSLTVADATLLQKYATNLADFNEIQLGVSDVNGDGKIDIADATEIQKIIAGVK